MIHTTVDTIYRRENVTPVFTVINTKSVTLSVNSLSVQQRHTVLILILIVIGTRIHTVCTCALDTTQEVVDSLSGLV